MDGEIDFTTFDDSELLERLGRIDPQRAPVNYARLKGLLIERGFVVRDALMGPASAAPSPDKLQTLIGSPSPIRCRIAFGQTTGLFSWLEPAHNDFEVGGSGMLQADGINLQFSGRHTGAVRGLFGPLFQKQISLSWPRIVDVESEGNEIHLAYLVPEAAKSAITLWFPNQPAAERLASVLPKKRTPEFRPQLRATVQFERGLVAQSPRTPVTIGLIAVNALIFLATAAAAAVFGRFNSAFYIPWGSNYGPYTSDGDWWRLFAGLFLHLGVLHLVFNMWALASFGPLVERLYGSVNYLALYLLAGMGASLASIIWQPSVNSLGASGAILGVLGALLAAQLRAGDTFPQNIVRPLRNSTLIFTAYCLINGFTSTGVDNAAHLGGLATGFFLGLVMVRPITGSRTYTRSDLRRLMQTLPLAALIAIGGVWIAKRMAESLTGQPQFARTMHWFRRGEERSIDKLHAAQAKIDDDHWNSAEFAAALDRDVLSFWREAVDRLAAIRLAPNSDSISKLEFMQKISASRLHAYERFKAAAITENAEEMRASDAELKQGDKLLSEWQTAHQ
ncbi:MAG TPA: rhomboid family intramembrane serine protease [Steroidobacteraceae bacterium]|jgi:rhomboid protease GluP